MRIWLGLFDWPHSIVAKWPVLIGKFESCKATVSGAEEAAKPPMPTPAHLTCPGSTTLPPEPKTRLKVPDISSTPVPKAPVVPLGDRVVPVENPPDSKRLETEDRPMPSCARRIPEKMVVSPV